ncbi:MAG: hypothetical protein WAN46_12230 [Gammaproteobacteria bacterium]|jgi:hypothetical protein
MRKSTQFPNGGNPSSEDQSNPVSLQTGMFVINMREDPAGRIIVIGKASRRRATTFLNIPISKELRDALDNQIVGSLAMGAGALLEWALTELKRQQLSLEARPRT